LDQLAVSAISKWGMRGQNSPATQENTVFSNNFVHFEMVVGCMFATHLQFDFENGRKGARFGLPSFLVVQIEFDNMRGRRLLMRDFHSEPLIWQSNS
jgi:hypothetical protein